MSDNEQVPAVPPSNPQGAPRPRRVRQRDWLPSLVWVIPMVAAVIGLTLVFKLMVDRGPEITISFRSAEGLEAGKTQVKYKDVNIGTVQAIRLSEDRTHVLTTVKLTKEAKSFTASDTRFWVVRPRVAASGVSGIGTLLSGAYIAADAGTSKESADEFAGLEAPPIITRDASGKQFVLHADDLGSLDIGSPVYYRRMVVGQVAAYEMNTDGKGVTLRLFINAPYDKFVGVNTRFWHASGFDVELNASGFKLHTQALATVLLGGVAFRAPDDEFGAVAGENTEFQLAASEEAALKPPDGPGETLLLYFHQSVRGLSPGAVVDFRGVALGEVKSIGIEYDDKAREFVMPVLIQVYPERLGRKLMSIGRATQKYDDRQRLAYFVGRGLRAQLRPGNLLTGQIYVALDFFPNAPPAKIDLSKTPLELPTIPATLDELQTQISEIARRLSKVPFDEIGADLRKTMKTLNRTLDSAEKLTDSLNNDVAPEVTAAMKDVRKTLDSANKTLSEDAPLQQDLRQTLKEVSRAAGSLRILSDYLERHPESLIRGKPEDGK
ncbi:MAG: mce related family protein [Herbaspirillum sp.]|jgi:paraquat-inducible protein B|nr:mce related family protein [Herbaspirillum sp.]